MELLVVWWGYSSLVSLACALVCAKTYIPRSLRSVGGVAAYFSRQNMFSPGPVGFSQQGRRPCPNPLLLYCVLLLSRTAGTAAQLPPPPSRPASAARPAAADAGARRPTLAWIVPPFSRRATLVYPTSFRPMRLFCSDQRRPVHCRCGSVCKTRGARGRGLPRAPQRCVRLTGLHPPNRTAPGPLWLTARL